MVPTRGIPYPAGDPSLDSTSERQWRRTLLETALVAVSTPVDRPTIFEPSSTAAQSTNKG